MGSSYARERTFIFNCRLLYTIHFNLFFFGWLSRVLSAIIIAIFFSFFSALTSLFNYFFVSFLFFPSFFPITFSIFFVKAPMFYRPNYWKKLKCPKWFLSDLDWLHCCACYWAMQHYLLGSLFESVQKVWLII